MMSEEWSAWSPLPNMRGEFSLGDLLDDEDGLHLSLKNDTGRTLRLDFRSTLAYRLTGRAIAPPEWRTDSVRSGESSVFSFSRSSAWTAEASARDPESQAVLHFVIALPGEVIDVLTDEEPNAAWENSLFGDAI